MRFPSGIGNEKKHYDDSFHTYDVIIINAGEPMDLGTCVYQTAKMVFNDILIISFITPTLIMTTGGVYAGVILLFLIVPKKR